LYIQAFRRSCRIAVRHPHPYAQAIGFFGHDAIGFNKNFLASDCFTPKAVDFHPMCGSANFKILKSRQAKRNGPDHRQSQSILHFIKFNKNIDIPQHPTLSPYFILTHLPSSFKTEGIA